MPEGDYVCAVDAGVVTVAAQNQPVGFPAVAPGAWGTCVEVLHPDGESSVYCHLKGLMAYPGQQVRKGQAIGTVGATGRAWGAHLHIERHRGLVRLDPAERLPVV
jgi:murein DD-endopeptidase MepM/ murein hydrolase activator NlpD